MHRIGVRAHYVGAGSRRAADAGYGRRTDRQPLVVRRSGVRAARAARRRARRDRPAGAGHGRGLRPHGVASVSLYPGLVLTESVRANLRYFEDQTNRETPRFVGRVVAALAADPEVMRLSGRWLVAAEIADAYGVVDEHGHLPLSNRPEILGEPVPPN